MENQTSGIETVIEKAKDLFLFREGKEENEEGTIQPIITTGSVVWGVLLRSAIIIFLGFLIAAAFEMNKLFWFFFFIFWFVAVYPGWRQYQLFQKRIKNVEESTLCGSCKHFEKTSQLCKIFDEHVSKDYIPCEGLNWEPKHFDSDEGN